MEPIDKINSIEQLQLQTSDNRIVEISLDQTRMSDTITDVLKEMGGSTDQVVPLPQVDYETIQPILEYLKYHFERPEEHENYRGEDKGCEDIGEWDKKFITGLSRDLLAKVTLAANYLAINDLLMLCCKHIAFVIKDMSFNQQREYFTMNDGIIHNGIIQNETTKDKTTNQPNEEKYERESRIDCPSCGQSNRKDRQICLKCSTNLIENDNNAI